MNYRYDKNVQKKNKTYIGTDTRFFIYILPLNPRQTKIICKLHNGHYKKIVLIGEDILVDELGDQQGLNHENVGQIRCNLLNWMNLINTVPF